MPGGGRCQWPATAIEKSPFKRGCVVARRPLLCWFWESKSPKATLHSEVGFGIKVRNSHTQFHSASNVNESKALKKLQKYPQITDITFSCLLFRFQSTSFTFFTCNYYSKVASFWWYLSNLFFIPFGRLFWIFTCFRLAARWLGAQKQAKIQKSLPKWMKRKFKRNYQKLATLVQLHSSC